MFLFLEEPARRMLQIFNMLQFKLDQKDGKEASDPDYDPRTLYIPKSAWATFTPFEKQVRTT